MACPEVLRTQAYIDGEVDESGAAEAERHIEGCAECQAFCADAAALSDDIRRLAPRYRAPDALRLGIARALDEQERADPRARRAFWSGAFGGAALTGLAAALAFAMILPPSPDGLIDKVTDTHVQALMSGREIEVASSDHHTVKPWFAGRIPISPPVTDFAEQGFKLTGGRLGRIAGGPAAVVVYQHGRHEIDLFVWADRGGALPAAGVRHGYHSIFWKKDDLDFAVVSDAQAEELVSLRNLVRAEPE